MAEEGRGPGPWGSGGELPVPFRSPGPLRGPAAQEEAARWVLGALLAQYEVPGTRRNYEAALRAWAGWCAARELPLFAARAAHVTYWLLELQEAGRCPGYRAARLTALHRFYQVAVREGIAPLDPTVGLRRPRPRRDSPRLGLELDEVRRLLAAAAGDGARSRALAWLLAANGLRASELLGLTPGDLQVRQGHRVAWVTRKGGHREAVPLAPPTAAALDALLAELAGWPADAPLFELSLWDLRREVKRLARLAGLACQREITTHDLRHTFVTQGLAATSGDLYRVQRGAGHVSPATTDGYNRARDQLDGHVTYVVAEWYQGDG